MRLPALPDLPSVSTPPVRRARAAADDTPRNVPSVSGKAPVMATNLYGVLAADDRANRITGRRGDVRANRDASLSLIRDDLELLGIADLLADSDALLDQADELHMRLRAARGEADKEHAAIMGALLDGKASVEDVIAQTSRAASLHPEAGEAARVITKARQILSRRAEASARQQAPTIESRLGDVAREAALASAELAKQLPADIDSERLAVRAGVDVMQVWAGLTEQYRRFMRCHAVADNLRTLNWISTFAASSLAEQEARDAEPEPSPTELNRVHFSRFRMAFRLVDELDPAGAATIIEYLKTPRALRLPFAVRVGAEPGLYTAEFARRSWQDWVKALRPNSDGSYRKTTAGTPIASEIF